MSCNTLNFRFQSHNIVVSDYIEEMSCHVFMSYHEMSCSSYCLFIAITSQSTFESFPSHHKCVLVLWKALTYTSRMMKLVYKDISWELDQETWEINEEDKPNVLMLHFWIHIKISWWKNNKWQSFWNIWALIIGIVRIIKC